MAQSAIATAADYADAMSTARKAKNVLFAILFFTLLGQLALFFFVRYKPDYFPAPAPEAGTLAFSGSDKPIVVTTTNSTIATEPRPSRLLDVGRYAIDLSVFAGIAATLVLVVVLMLIINIMLVGRLIGISGVTRAFIGCVILAVLLFPWQIFMPSSNFGSTDFIPPGVLYTWDELIQRSHWHSPDLIAPAEILHWARFVVFPALALGILVWLQSQSTRGIRLALGEISPGIDDDTPTA